MKPLCADLGHNALYLYQRALEIQDYLNKRIEAPPDHAFTSLQDALAFSHSSAKAFLTKDEFGELTRSVEAIKKHLPPATQLPPEEAAVRWERLGVPRREANQLVDKVEELLLRKVVECECKKKD